MLKTEQVLVFPSNLFDLPNGFDRNYSRYINKIFCRKPLFIDRDLAEDDSNFKQLIPYQVLKKQNKYFTYRRSPKGNEDRLKGKLSLGIGGHINSDDENNEEIIDDLDLCDTGSTYLKGTFRELKEEVNIKPYFPTSKIIGAIYDGNSEVGRVHFGIVHLLEISRENHVEIVDPALIEPGWMDINELRRRHDEFEEWSKLVINNLKS